MNSPSDSSLPLARTLDLEVVRKSESYSPDSGFNLVFTQDLTGHYLSFCWREAERYGFQSDQLVGHRMGEARGSFFSPVAIASYLNRIHQVLEQQTPQRFSYPFQCGEQYLVFDLTVSPILVPQSSPLMAPQGTTTTVVIIGQFLYAVSEVQALDLINSLLQPEPVSYSGKYQRLLTQVAWNIRRTLDLDTIWQQTVDGLGEALGVSRCLICPYTPGDKTVKVVAEYHQLSFKPLLELELSIQDEFYLEQALVSLQPVALTVTRSALDDTRHSLLAVATCYQDQPNGLIILHQFERSRIWNEVELEQIRELADQVGTGIAHANLFSASRDLAIEFQRTNDNLMQQHRDLEEARRQAEEASRLKSEFLANTSHELRTPLNGMIGFLKLVMDGMADDPEEQNEFIQEAYRSAVHLLSIINDILDIAKIEAGKMQLDLNPVRLDDLLNDVENFTRPQAQQKGLNFQIFTPATRDEVVLCGNYQRLLQVMLNLVGNAIKFTHEGGITITAEIINKKSKIQEQECFSLVKISVADTGIGVSLEKQDKLFQSFSQVDGSRTRQYGGTGLGLAISQKLVEAMGGIVNFYSLGEGLGSTVTFTVPLYQDPVMIATEAAVESDLLV